MTAFFSEISWLDSSIFLFPKVGMLFLFMVSVGGSFVSIFRGGDSLFSDKCSFIIFVAFVGSIFFCIDADGCSFVCSFDCVPAETNTINVQGTSELTFDPDEAEVWAGISIVEDSADDAQSEANEVIGNIIEGLKSQGISENDISTERLSLYEERSWENGKSEIKHSGSQT